MATPTALITPMTKSIATVDNNAWEKLEESKRRVAMKRFKLVRYCLDLQEQGVSLSSAINNLTLSIDEGGAEIELVEVSCELGRKGKPVNRATLHRWCKAYDDEGLVGLAPTNKGSSRKSYGWEARAIHLYKMGSKMAASAVADCLQEEGFESATESRVRRYINSLPEDVKQRGRKGAKLFLATEKSFVRRNNESLPVGACYMGDGHTIDVYLQHPVSGDAWRAELTVWMDVRSRYITGWYISEAESAHSTLYAISYALTTFDHIPALLYIDNGSGYKNKMMSTESNGFYDRFGMSIVHSQPYNAKAKGQIERWFRTMEESFGKRFHSYCGKDMDDETLQRVLKEAKAKERPLPTLHRYIEELNNWITHYHNRPHRGLKTDPFGDTPAKVWSHLERCPVEPKTAALFWPREVRTVGRSSITLHNREYTAPDLIQYNRKKVTIEYSIHDDSFVRVIDAKGRWICDAELINKVDTLPASRIEEAKQKRLESQVKRLEKHIEEKKARAGMAITHEDDLKNLDSIDMDGVLDEKEKGSSWLDPDLSLNEQESGRETIKLNLFDDDEE